MLSVLGLYALFSLVLTACTDNDHQVDATACTTDCVWTDAASTCTAPDLPETCVVAGTGTGCTPDVGCVFTAANLGTCRSSTPLPSTCTELNEATCGTTGGCTWTPPTGSCSVPTCSAACTETGCTSSTTPPTCVITVDCPNLDADECQAATTTCVYNSESSSPCSFSGTAPDCSDPTNCDTDVCTPGGGDTTCSFTGGACDGTTEGACDAANTGCTWESAAGSCGGTPVDLCASTPIADCGTTAGCEVVGATAARCDVAPPTTCPTPVTLACDPPCEESTTPGSCADKPLDCDPDCTGIQICTDTETGPTCQDPPCNPACVAPKTCVAGTCTDPLPDCVDDDDCEGDKICNDDKVCVNPDGAAGLSTPLIMVAVLMVLLLI